MHMDVFVFSSILITFTSLLSLFIFSPWGAPMWVLLQMLAISPAHSETHGHCAIMIFGEVLFLPSYLCAWEKFFLFLRFYVCCGFWPVSSLVSQWTGRLPVSRGGYRQGFDDVRNAVLRRLSEMRDLVRNIKLSSHLHKTFSCSIKSTDNDIYW